MDELGGIDGLMYDLKTSIDQGIQEQDIPKRQDM